MLPVSVVAISAGIGVALASINSGLTIIIAVLALKKSALTAGIATAVGMFVRLAALAIIFFALIRAGYEAGPLLFGFVITYTILLGVEFLVLSRRRSS